MKGLVLVAAGLALATAIAQDATRPPTITTSGTAEIQVVPDLADLSFEVEVRGAELAVARKQHSERAAKVLAALRSAGVAEGELQTSQVELAPDYGQGRAESEKVKFYRVSQRMYCTINDLKRIPDITADAVAAGATMVGGVTLRTTELRKHRDEARARAIRLAREKAVALAAEVGARVGKPYRIEEGAGSTGFASNNAAYQVSAAAAETTSDQGTLSFAPGTISVTASVSVTFLLE